MADTPSEEVASPPRRLTLADLALLVASAAGGMVILRMLVEDRSESLLGRRIGGMTIGLILAPFLLTTSLALVIARLRGPRPAFLAAIRQPGTLACIAFLAFFAIDLTSHAASIAVGSWLGESYVKINVWLFLFTAMNAGAYIAPAWATLALAGRWRPEPGWIDRSGRVLGVVAMAVDLLARILP